jgi:predicted AAA+ superfamily ATPase
MISRTLYNTLKEELFKGKAIILTGARQVGKTTLMKELASEYGSETVLSLNCDEPVVIHSLEDVSTAELRRVIGNSRLVLIDEAQRVKNIGITLKLIIDNLPDVQLLVSGSSSFDLHNKVNEPLTGRKFEYQLYPFSTEELIGASSYLEEKSMLEHRMIYGMYPDVVNHADSAKKILLEITNSYLFKDILSYGDIRRPDVLNRLLTAIALQLGNEVTYSELSNTLGIDRETVVRYLDLLEKVFIIFRLHSFSRNLRNELKKSQKVYFYDNGVRNALVNNFNPLALRNDTGALWENFTVSERKKINEYHDNYVFSYFWRTQQQQEIDYIEEKNGTLFAFELKWNEKRHKTVPSTFARAYPRHEYKVINRTNYMDFLLPAQ